MRPTSLILWHLLQRNAFDDLDWKQTGPSSFSDPHSQTLKMLSQVCLATLMLIGYLAKNDGLGEGSRVILGGGLSVPSKSQLTADPFFLNGEEKESIGILV